MLNEKQEAIKRNKILSKARGLIVHGTLSEKCDQILSLIRQEINENNAIIHDKTNNSLLITNQTNSEIIVKNKGIKK